MNPQPKLKPYRNARYKSYIRKHGCVFCGGTAEAHHVRRLEWGAGVGIKPHDYACIPLCHVHHTPDSEKCIDVDNLIIGYLVGFAKKYHDKRKLIDVLMQFIDERK